jgi:hypothetical protein
MAINEFLTEINRRGAQCALSGGGMVVASNAGTIARFHSTSAALDIAAVGAAVSGLAIHPEERTK